MEPYDSENFKTPPDPAAFKFFQAFPEICY